MLKIATFNLFKDEANVYERIKAISSDITNHQFDFIALQEDFRCDLFHSGATINQKLKYELLTNDMRKKIRKGKESFSNLTILSRHKILKHKYFDFTLYKNNERGFSIVNSEAYGKHITVINTHLSHLSSGERILQINAILKAVKGIRSDFIVLCGDFNATPQSLEIKKILAHNFISQNLLPTHTSKTLDYIFVKSKEDFSISYETAFDGCSDHQCLIATIRW